MKKTIWNTFISFFVIFSFATTSFAGYNLGRKIKVRVLSKEKLSHIQVHSQDSRLLISDRTMGNPIINDNEKTIVTVDFIDGKLRVISPSAEYWTSKVIFFCDDPVNGLLSIRTPKTQPRRYHGSLHIEIMDGSLIVINQLPMEQYLYGVIPSEMSPKWELNALKAQAIVSRTYAYKNIGRHEEGGYDFCDLTHCQAYKGYDGERAKTNWAVDGTRSLVISYNGQLIDAYYHSTCGGKTSRGDEVWSGTYKPYLISVSDIINNDIACRISPHFQWDFKVSKQRLFQVLSNNKDTNSGHFLKTCTVESQYPNERVKYITISGEQNKKISGWQFRRILCKTFGWNSIKSSNFQIEDCGDLLIFRGKGLGHGVGMCQYGALSRAQAGFSPEEILTFYFPATQIKPMIY